jgi:hypothetical protein
MVNGHEVVKNIWLAMNGKIIRNWRGSTVTATKRTKSHHLIIKNHSSIPSEKDKICEIKSYLHFQQFQKREVDEEDEDDIPCISQILSTWRVQLWWH